MKEFDTVRLYVLEDWDGADGRMNRPNGFITNSKSVADKFVKDGIGTSYKTVKGILIDSLESMKEGRDFKDKQEALAKLSDREKKLLGLV